MIIEDLVDARILVELNSRLSFIDAAKALGIPPATVSRRLMRMENRAGLRLFERTTRTVTPTEAGSLAASHAIRMISEVEAIDISLSSMRAVPTGTVRVTTPSIFGQALLGPIVASFLENYPDCDLQIDLSDAHNKLADDGYDVAVRIGPVVDETLVARCVGSVRAALFQRTSAPPVTVDKLQECPIALLHPGKRPVPSLELTSEDGEIRDFSVKPRLVCMNPWLLRDTCLEVDMVSVLPELIATPEVRAGRLKRVAIGWFARRVPVNVVYQTPRMMRPAVRAFIDLATDQIPILIANAEAD